MSIEEEKLKEVGASFTWKDKLMKDTYNVKGVPVEHVRKCPENYITFLECHPKYAGKLRYNEYSDMKEFDGKEFDDMIEDVIFLDSIREMGIQSRELLTAALSEVFMKNTYNPVVEYLKDLKWDGKKRIERLFIDLLDADDTALNRTMTRKWMTAAVKRILIPGSKFDPMIVLQGSGGIGKSTICERLARGFFSSISLDEIDNKDLVAKMNRTWIGIIDELDSFKKKDMDKVKGFLSQTESTARLAYARNPKCFKRHCVFIGSTNDDTFLRDYTSPVERRFWVIRCNRTQMDGSIYDTMNPKFVDQLWAEAYHYYVEDPDQYLDLEPEFFDEFAQVQREFKTYNNDDMVEYIRDILDKQYNIGEDGEVTDIGQIDDFSAGKRNQISKIHAPVISKLIRREFHDNKCKNKYLASALSGEWRYCDTQFKTLGGVTKKAWVRLGKTSGDKDRPYNPMDEFTVGMKI